MRYLLGFLAIIGLVVVVAVLIIRGLGGEKLAQNTAPLTDYTFTDTVVQLTIEGPVNNDAVHQSLRMTVGRSETKAEALQGYQDQVFDTISYPNNTDAYGVFLRALDLLKFDVGSDNPSLEDARGYCPDGKLYTLQIMDGSSQLQRYWQTSCGQGNFRGQLPKIIELFQTHIPDYNTFARNVNL